MNRAIVFWLTGLSGSGKSTIANKFKKLMTEQGKTICIIDGDDVRQNKHSHLSFSVEDIKQNAQLITQLVLEKQIRYDYILVSVITPFKESRTFSSHKIGDTFVEVYVKANLKTVIERDTKGLYKKALNSEIENFIGISQNVPYEVPFNPGLILDTENNTIEACVQQLIYYKSSS